MSVYRVGGNKSSQNVFPSVRPTLDLDFANSKTLDPRITFTRASGGSYVGADGLIKYAGVNEARFDHDPSTGESLGLLIEEARTNLLLRSEEFDNASWAKVQSNLIPNQATAPNGTLTADKLIEDTSNNQHAISQNVSVSSGATVSTSVYFKSSERKFGRIIVYRTDSEPFSNNFSVIFDILGGNIFFQSQNGNGILLKSDIQSVGNGWFRAHITGNVPNATQYQVRVNIIRDNQTNPNYTGDGTSGIYIWGAQLEVGAFPTSYIPTQAATRTRAADNASITGKNFSEWYRQDEGSVVIKARTNVTTDGISNRFPYSMQIDSGVGSTNFAIDNGVLTNGAIRQVFVAQVGGVTISSGMGNNLSYNGLPCSFAYKTDDLAFINGGGTLFTKGNAPLSKNMVRLLIGTGNGGLIRGTVQSLKYFPKRLPNEQLRALTR
jgi:hypothetical protein